jgi:hypothetical protein
MGDVKYVDWVEEVLLGLRDAKGAQASPSIYLSEDALAQHLGVADKTRGPEAVGDAIRDLVALDAVEQVNHWNLQITSKGKHLAERSLRALWPDAEEIWVDTNQTEYLAALIEMSEWRTDTHASLNDVDEDDLVARLQWETREDVNVDLRELRNDLRQRGLIAGQFTAGRSMIYPTYAAIVKMTELNTLADTQLVRDLLRHWEGVNVDFKQELSLRSKDDKVEFVRDILALVNPQVAAGRYLVIGFDNKTRKFHASVDPTIRHEQMEHLLNEYTESEFAHTPVTIRYRHVAWTDPAGTAGLVEVARDAADVPYRVRKGLRGAMKELHLHQILVRHGSHVAEPDDEELAALRSEAEWARAERRSKTS